MPPSTPTYQIDFSQIPPATTAEAAGRWFAARAQVVTHYNACRRTLDGELFRDELDFTTVAIAKLARAQRGASGGADFSSLRLFMITHGFDPAAGVRGFIRASCPDATRLRTLLDGASCCGQDADNIAQVNDALLRCQVRSKVGTSGDFPCKRTGEYDVALRGLITIMYRYRQLLRPEVYDHVLHDLLNQRGKHDPSIETVDCTGFSVPETENHVLLIETCRYLTNQLLLEEARKNGGDAPEFDNERNGMNEWMLKKLQGFLRHDFSEYNARPYQVYSTMAIQNLYDFADDRDPDHPEVNRVRIAARMVLDYISAKFAVSSNGLRRAAPFRRRKENKDSTSLFDNAADPQTQRFILLSGLTQRLAEVQPPSHAAYGGRDIMQLAAVSGYRVPYMILDLVINESHKSYYQRFRHAGVEIYASSPQFLITAGGIWMESVHGMDEFNQYGDAGWALPTTLMPTEGGTDRAAFIRIDGAPEDHARVNTGVAPGFACGLNPFIPPSYLASTNTVSAGGAPLPACSSQHGPWTFIDASGRCNNERSFGFYVAVYSSACTTSACVQAAGSPSDPARGAFGFFEATPSDNLDFEAFQRGVLEKNGQRTYTSEGINEYVTVADRTIRFIPNPPGNKYRWGIIPDNDPPDIADWPLAQGDIINSEGHSGLVTIDNPFLQTRITLDMRDPLHPRRTAPVPGLRQLLGSYGFDPGRGVREFVRDVSPGTPGLRSLLAV